MDTSGSKREKMKNEKKTKRTLFMKREIAENFKKDQTISFHWKTRGFYVGYLASLNQGTYMHLFLLQDGSMAPLRFNEESSSISSSRVHRSKILLGAIVIVGITILVQDGKIKHEFIVGSCFPFSRESYFICHNSTRSKRVESRW